MRTFGKLRCLTFVWKTLLSWKPSQHKREELRCLAPHDPSLSPSAGEKRVFLHLSFPARAAFYLTRLLLWWGEVQCPCWCCSPLCFWPRRGDWTRKKRVSLELVGLRWKGTTGKKIHLSFITFRFKYMGRIRSYIFILESWDLGAYIDIYARLWVGSETILLWCACTSSVFLWFSCPVIYQRWVSSGVTKCCWLCGFHCDQRAWPKEEQNLAFFPMRRLLHIKNNEGEMTKCGRFEE